MRNFIILSSVILLSACATPTPITQEIKDKVAQMSADDLPRNSTLEQTRCPKSRYHTFDKRMNCKIAVRRELAARKMLREESIAIEEKKNEQTQN
jgi:hypothetical protein